MQTQQSLLTFLYATLLLEIFIQFNYHLKN